MPHRGPCLQAAKIPRGLSIYRVLFSIIWYWYVWAIWLTWEFEPVRYVSHMVRLGHKGINIIELHCWGLKCTVIGRVCLLLLAGYNCHILVISKYFNSNSKNWLYDSLQYTLKICLFIAMFRLTNISIVVSLANHYYTSSYQ
jgi:hypothetical protein